MVTTRLLQRDEFWPGDELEDYTLLERIGLGGEATVWSGWDTNTDRVVAIKFIHTKVSDPLLKSVEDPEVLLVKSLHHPNILPVYDVGKSDEYTYFSMQYFPMGSLANLLTFHRLPVEEVLKIAAQMVSALEYLHSNGIVHRDLKPTNVMLDVQGRVYITDFGLARQLSQDTRMIHTGQGTPQYSPPEQHTRKPLIRRSDIYSLGVMLYEMFAGSLPWGGEAALAIMQLDKGVEIPDPRQYNTALPSNLTLVLRALTNADPEKRPHSAAAAFNLIKAAFVNSIDRDETMIAPSVRVQQALDSVPPAIDYDTLALKESDHLLKENLYQSGGPTDKFNLSLTNFAYLHSVYSNPNHNGRMSDAAFYTYMTQGAITHGFNQNYWWHAQEDPKLQVQVCERVFEYEDEEAITRAVNLMLADPSRFEGVDTIPFETNLRLINLASESNDSTFTSRVLDLLGALAGTVKDWDVVRYNFEADNKIAAMALSDEPHALSAARFIGQIRSESALKILLDRLEQQSSRRGFQALVEVYRGAGSLPASIPNNIRFRVMAELARQQLFDDRPGILRGYLAAFIAFALGLAAYTYMGWLGPEFLNTGRILTAIGSGLIVGPLVGLGIYITLLVIERLKALSKGLRVLVGMGLGTVIVNFGLVVYHVLFLDAFPKGWLVLFGSFVMILGFGIGAIFFQNKGLRAILSVISTAIGLALTWFLSNELPLTSAHLPQTPMLYYDVDRLGYVYSITMILATSLLTGIVSHLEDLWNSARSSSGNEASA